MPGNNRSSERFLYTINRTFNLPSVIGSRTITGINNVNDIGYKDVGGLPNITGNLNFLFHRTAPVSAGAFYERAAPDNTSIGTGNYLANYYVGFDASRSSGIYNSNNTEVQPKRILMYFIIKYI